MDRRGASLRCATGVPDAAAAYDSTELVEVRGHGRAARATWGATAFTLIEMLVVIALAAILSTIVGVSLARTARAARTEDVAGQISAYARAAREYSRRFGRAGALVFDLNQGSIRAADDAGGSLGEGRAALYLRSSFHLRRVVTLAGAASSGLAAIPCSSNGQTPSYAILLTGAAEEPFWVMTAGLTGKTLKVHDEREVQDIFQALASSSSAPAHRDDAH